VQRQDGLRRDAANEEGGDAFRAAFDDVGSKRTATRRSEQDRLDARRTEERQRSRSNRQKDDTRGAADEAKTHGAAANEPAHRRGDETSAEGSKHTPTDIKENDSTASRGGFGSDPSVSAVAGAGGSAGPNNSTSSGTALAAGLAGSTHGGGRHGRSTAGTRALGEDLRVAASTPWGAGLPSSTADKSFSESSHLAAELSKGSTEGPMPEKAPVQSASAGGPNSPQGAEPSGVTAQQLAALEVLDAMSSQSRTPTAGLDPVVRGGDGSLSGTTQLTAQAVGSVAGTSATTAQPTLSAFRGGGPELTTAGGAGSTGPMAEPEPMPGSVHLSGIRGARVVVPLEDGATMRARVDVVDEQVDVRLVSSGDGALLAERRESDLRDGLAQKGLQLGEFEVSTSESDDSRADDQLGAEQERRESRSTSRRGRGSNHRSEPAQESSDGSPRHSSDDGNGNLLNLRL